SVQPTSALKEGKRVVPMEERHPRGNARLKQCVDEAIVKGKTGLIGLTRSARQNARPRNTQSIRIDPEGLHQCDVLTVAIVVIAGRRTVVRLVNGARLLTKHVPDAWPLAIGILGPFNLVGSRCCAPQKFLWKFVDLALLIHGHDPSYRARRCEGRSLNLLEEDARNCDDLLSARP